MVATRRIVSIDIVSDTVCPWCFIGKRRMERAMQKYTNQLEFQVNWHPFFLNPNASRDGMNKLEFYKKKFGPEKTAQIMPHMAQLFAAEGLKFSAGGLTGSTLDSHRLILLAGKQGPAKQDALVEELFKNYFCEEKFINDRNILLAAAEKAGVNGAREWLEDPSNGAAEIQEEIKTRTRGINGVPNFTIDGRFQVSGAQAPEYFEDVFRRIINQPVAA